MSLSRAFELPAEDDRSSARYRLLLEIRSDDKSSTTPVIMHDVSRTGLLFETDEPISADKELALELPEVGVAAVRIAWSSGRLYGAQFVSPLAPSAFKKLYSQSKVIWPAFQSAAGPSQRSVEPLCATEEPSATESQKNDTSGSLPVAIRIQILIIISIALWAGLVAGLAAVLA